MLVVTAAGLFVIAGSLAVDLPPTKGPVPAERLLISYSSGGYQLLSRTPLTKVIPPSDTLPATNGALSGFWFEVQTPQADVKYRRILPDPTKVYTEVPGPGPDPQPERAEASRTEAVFSVLIPQLPGSNNLVLVSGSIGGTSDIQEAKRVARIPLAALPK